MGLPILAKCMADQTGTNTKLGKFVVDKIQKMVELGATLVDDQVFEKRVKICEACPFYGLVLLESFQVKGCQKCGCPTETKAKTETFYSLLKLKVVKTTCPHPDGDKWDF